MSRSFYFITHPNVVIDPDVPVPRWPLSALGRTRMTRALNQPWISEISAVYSSTEQKAIDGAEIIATHRNLPFHQIPDLGENDRSSTGCLQSEEFEQTAHQFFAHPHASVRGWETARDAQTRIVNAVTCLAQSDQTHGTIAIVSHGAVGTLFYCHAASLPISRRWDQPPNGGGNYFQFQLDPLHCESWWQPLD
jgi:broad specificity phosphatase PhoE